MRVLLDNNVDHRFARLIVGHEVTTARAMGWAELENGELIRAAEQAGFAAMITADKNLRYQQNLLGRTISIIVLGSRFVDYIGIAPLADEVVRQLEMLPQGAFVEVKPAQE